MSQPPQWFDLGRFEFSGGQVREDARLAYATYGTLAPDRSNVILYPTSYGAQHPDIDWLIGPEGILDSRRWFIVIINMFGNGLSSSPSNLAGWGLAHQGFRFSHLDNVRAQEHLLRQVFGIEQLALVYGWSMGAQQAYHWGAMFPERVARIAALCGTAWTRPHNWLFLESLKAALTADPAWNGDRFTGTPERGFRAFARIYASWAASQTFYRWELFRPLGFDSLEDYLERAWEPGYRRRDPHDLLAMIETWQACDLAQVPGAEGDIRTALGRIRARTLVIPSTTDLYFPVDDCAEDAALIADARLLPIASLWGHRAGNPAQNPADATFIRSAIAELLAD